jgi:hypothetical protein
LNSRAELGIAVFGNALAGFLGGSQGGPLDRFGDVVGGVPLPNECQEKGRSSLK